MVQMEEITILQGNYCNQWLVNFY